MLGKYLRLWIMRAADNSVMLTDKLTILIVPCSTLVLWMTGTKMTESVQETLALGVAMTVVAVVLLRLGAASFWLWRDDQVEMRKQAASLKEELGRHGRMAREAAIAYTTKLRTELRENFAKKCVTIKITF